MDRFAITDTGEVSLILGMSISRDYDKGTLTMSQADYLHNVLERFGMLECNSQHTWIRARTIQRAAEKPIASERHQALPGNRGVAILPRTGYTLRHLLCGQPTHKGTQYALNGSYDRRKTSAPMPKRVA